MKILLSGVETNNKGAELMLYAILQEIERKDIEATVYVQFSQMRQGLGYVKTNIDLRYTPFSELVYKMRLPNIFRRLHLPTSFFWSIDMVKDADWFIDGSGFAFSDQWNLSDERVAMWENRLRLLKKQGCKIVFLPQAFGPIELSNTKKMISILDKYASIIMPREQVSYNYLKQSGMVDMNKVKLYTDFTSLVDGVFPVKYEKLRDGICIIPNKKMIDKGGLTFDEYVEFLASIIREVKKDGRTVYLLNHEGPKDEELAYKCQQRIGNDIEVITQLNALEVKGLIASAYLVITSRFHGLASALNSCVPALSTSWSHKYEELYHDYALDSYVLPLNDKAKALEEIKKLLDIDENTRIRGHLKKHIPLIKEQTREMWNTIWGIQTK